MMNLNQSSDDTASGSLNYYNQNAQKYYDNTVSLDVSTLTGHFLKYLPVNAHILDAGCGSGRDTLYFIQQGYRVTAFDASEEMVKMAHRLTGKDILQMTFLEAAWVNEFDGIWACASLLHVPRAEIDQVVYQLSRSLKPGGIFYTSFKYGPNEVLRHERLFNDYDEIVFHEMASKHPELTIREIWFTSDVRPERQEKWLNAIFEKKT